MNKVETKLGIVIVTWNNEKDIKLCIDSIYRQSFKDLKIVLVDNASSDNTVQIVEQNFPDVEILKQQENLFLTGANNLGIQYLLENYGPEFVMVLNPDTYLGEDLIETLLGRIYQDPQIGAIGPKVMFWNNENEGKINSAGLVYDGFMQAYDRGFLEEDNGQYNAEEFVPAVTGACIIYRSEIFQKVGLYDTRIKLYLDELELAIRIRKAGYKILYYPKAVLGHSYMASTSNKNSIDKEKQKKFAWLIIALKHFPFKSKFAAFRKYLISKP